MHFLDSIYNLSEQVLLFLPLIYAVYFSYSVLKVTDVSIDGTMVLGAAITSKLLICGINSFLTIIITLISGFLSGCILAFIQKKGKVNDIISGLLMSFILYSINLNIMGKPHLTLIGKNILQHDKITLIMLVVLCVTLLCVTIMKLPLGLKMRAFGENRHLLYRLGFNAEKYRTIGLGISGSISTLYGATVAQTYGYADINMGFGIAITAIGGLIIGMHILSKINLFKEMLYNHKISAELLSCFIGVLCYFGLVNTLIAFEVDPINFKMILGIAIIIVLKTSKRRFS